MTTRNISAQDRENARRLKGIWNRKKGELGLTQNKAAIQLGYKSQGVVAQYLNCHIALNVEAILAFAKLLRVEPWEIDPNLGQLRPVALPDANSSVTIIDTLSGAGKPSTDSVEVRYTYMVGQCYGVEVDSDLYAPFARRGTVVVASRAEEPVPGDDVIILLDDDVRILAEFHGGDNEGLRITRHSTREEETLPVAQVRSIDPIVEVVRPRQTRPRRLRAV